MIERDPRSMGRSGKLKTPSAEMRISQDVRLISERSRRSRSPVMHSGHRSSCPPRSWLIASPDAPRELRDRRARRGRHPPALRTLALWGISPPCPRAGEAGGPGATAEPPPRALRRTPPSGTGARRARQDRRPQPPALAGPGVGSDSRRRGCAAVTVGTGCGLGTPGVW